MYASMQIWMYESLQVCTIRSMQWGLEDDPSLIIFNKKAEQLSEIFHCKKQSCVFLFKHNLITISYSKQQTDTFMSSKSLPKV